MRSKKPITDWQFVVLAKPKDGDLKLDVGIRLHRSIWVDFFLLDAGQKEVEKLLRRVKSGRVKLAEIAQLPAERRKVPLEAKTRKRYA